ncbi:hypothetical protein F4777DRAFT_568661 [Nemania sp. FL0916]|nr:hypothetical protein F4777DRAFT_568661 [Nemania sp. FL0916]
MASRFSAARPKRAGENYARQHHGTEPDSKKAKFDVRNPSALAPDAAEDDEEDAFLEADADVIRGSRATKHGAVNIDGYDSDSDREELGMTRMMKAKAQEKNGADEEMEDMFAEDDDDNDGKAVSTKPGGNRTSAADDDDDDGVDMPNLKPTDTEIDPKTGKKSKEVRFVNTNEIRGQNAQSRSGGHVSIDNNTQLRDEEESSDDDEEAIALEIAEEAVDEEVGAGGLKKHAPKLEAFNLKAENEEGRFDESGNFVRKAADPDAVHDRWLDGVSKKDMRRAAEAHERRDAERRQRNREEDSVLTEDLLKNLITHLERGETALEALARLGRAQNKLKGKVKKVPRWKQKKQAAAKNDAMDVDEDKEQDNGKGKGKEKEKEKEAEDPEQARIKEAIDAITDAADKLLGRDRPDIYDRERERLIREFVRATDEEWVEPVREPAAAAAESDGERTKTWEYRWTDGRDGADKQGPFDGKMMKAWQDAGYFGEGVEFREVGDEIWSRSADFI